MQAKLKLAHWVICVDSLNTYVVTFLLLDKQFFLMGYAVGKHNKVWTYVYRKYTSRAPLQSIKCTPIGMSSELPVPFTLNFMCPTDFWTSKSILNLHMSTYMYDSYNNLDDNLSPTAHLWQSCLYHIQKYKSLKTHWR